MRAPKLRAASGDAGLLAARQTPVEWLEHDHDAPGAFLPAAPHRPLGLLQVKPDHPADCACQTGDAWVWSDTAMKWRAS